jgi:hypothetical protein
MICQNCGVEAPTKYVEFYHNIGALVMRFWGCIKGNLCKSCIHRHFWKFTAINLFLGWWGVISFIVTPFFILNNTFRYLTCLFMPGVPLGATAPELTEAVVEKLGPHTDALVEQLNRGTPLPQVAEDIAMRAMVTPGQVVLYVQALVAASQQAGE